MEVIEPGHIYALAWLDGKPHGDAIHPKPGASPDHVISEDRLIFVNRDSEILGHPGTQCQEVIRALINRVEYCDARLPWDGNDEIIKHLREALALFEARALVRKTQKGILKPETIETGEDGHFKLRVEK